MKVKIEKLFMKIEINRSDEAYQMIARNEDGAIIQTDASILMGGQVNGFRPMQLLLAGIGSCSGIDIISILSKQRQSLKDIQIIVNGNREEGKTPSLFSDIHIEYILKGDLDEAKVARAVELSMDTYCSVAKILEKTATITYSYKINP